MQKLVLAFLLSLSLLAVVSGSIFPSPMNEVANAPGSSALFLAQATTNVIATPVLVTQSSDTPVPGKPPLSLTLILLGLCCFFLLFIGIFILGFVVRHQNIKEESRKEQPSEAR